MNFTTRSTISLTNNVIGIFMSLIKSIGSKKVNFDFNKNFISTFIEKINSSDLQFINQTLKDLHPSDVANLIENLPEDTRPFLIEP